jgi:signal transduction histidine kinase
MPTLILFVGIVSIAISSIVLWANPRRWLHQTFFIGTLLQALWLICVAAVILAGDRSDLVGVEFWLRLNAAISAFFPLGIWLVKESISNSHRKKLSLKKFLPWITIGVVLSSFSYSRSFLHIAPTGERLERGYGYYLYQAVAIPAYLFLVIDVLNKTRRLAGIRRIEMQFLALHLGIAAIAVTLLNTAGNIFGIAILKRTGPLVILFIHIASACAITAHRIFDIRQVFLSLGQRLMVLLSLSFGALGAAWFMRVESTRYAAIFIIASFFGAFGFWLDRRSRTWLDLDGERKLASARASLIGIEGQEADPDELKLKFSAFLRQENQTTHALLLSYNGDAHSSTTLTILKSRLGYSALCQMGWATPESLERRRPDPALADLQDFLFENNLGVIVTSPHGSESPALVVALGRKPNHWPFTYPEVQRLQNIAELMDSILARSRLAMQAAMQVKLEHMAMMSRGLAHDLSNLITPISSFLICTDGRFPVGTTEAEVHFAARRSIRVMGEYVREALFFSERLSPNFERVDPGALFRAVQDLTTAQATQQGVIISISSDYHDTFQGDTILLHRTLVNLVNNALDASKTGQVIELSATAGPLGRVLIKVSDCGSGVPPENIARIFDPYFTTKQFGVDVRGFGLGLTICQKIVHLHHGTISVSSRPNRGTTFTIDLPISPAPNGTRMTQTRVAPQPREIAIARPQPILT